MIREIAGSSLCERVCDKERERFLPISDAAEKKKCVNVRHFWGKPICNIDSRPSGAALKWYILASGLFAVSDQVSKQGEAQITSNSASA